MECRDIKLLLSFSERRCEELDAGERVAVRQHLEKCPDCAALAEAERRADATLGQFMRDVPIPSDLQQKVMKRLAANRPRTPWKWALPAAAAILLASLAGAGVYWTRLPVVHWQDVIAWPQRSYALDEEGVEKYFADEGLQVQAPRDFDYNHLRHIEIVEFKNRRVAKLSFHAAQANGLDRADVLILPHRQFRVEDFNDVTNIRITRNEDYTYLIFYQGDLNSLLRVLKN